MMMDNNNLSSSAYHINIMFFAVEHGKKYIIRDMVEVQSRFEVYHIFRDALSLHCDEA
jgi:hypothetical protein